MKLMITGACGHIGSYLAENSWKIKKVQELILVDNFYTGRYSSLFNLKKKIKISFHQIDIDKSNSLSLLSKVSGS